MALILPHLFSTRGKRDRFGLKEREKSFVRLCQEKGGNSICSPLGRKPFVGRRREDLLFPDEDVCADQAKGGPGAKGEVRTRLWPTIDRGKKDVAEKKPTSGRAEEAIFPN